MEVGKPIAGFRLFCGDCGARLFADDTLKPPPGSIYYINPAQMAFSCDCGHIGMPAWEEVPLSADQHGGGS